MPKLQRSTILPCGCISAARRIAGCEYATNLYNLIIQGENNLPVNYTEQDVAPLHSLRGYYSAHFDEGEANAPLVPAQGSKYNPKRGPAGQARFRGKTLI